NLEQFLVLLRVQELDNALGVAPPDVPWDSSPFHTRSNVHTSPAAADLPPRAPLSWRHATENQGLSVAVPIRPCPGARHARGPCGGERISPGPRRCTRAPGGNRPAGGGPDSGKRCEHGDAALHACGSRR